MSEKTSSEPHQWLTNDYLENVLRTSEKDQRIKVVSFNYKSAVAAGNNYASQILRCSVDYIQNDQTIKRSIIMKVMLVNEEAVKMLNEFGTFNGEVLMYEKVLFEFRKLLESINDNEEICPKLLHVDRKNFVIIFEDLNARGFELADRKKGVNMNHVHLVLRKVAKIHACSMVHKERTGENYESFQKGLIDDSVKSFYPFFEYNIQALANEVKTWPGYERYAIKLEKLVTSVIKHGKQLYKRDKGKYFVLNHGDCWVANMLFKYDDVGNPLDVILVKINQEIR